MFGEIIFLTSFSYKKIVNFLFDKLNPLRKSVNVTASRGKFGAFFCWRRTSTSTFLNAQFPLKILCDGKLCFEKGKC